ncbi:MAG TPA: hypothetical protein VNL77_10630 [Roseiflexaceae bacterium]|nr:hypothetical protein [Roseiflexaceae bacterium]
MLDREYELVRMQMREREREAHLARLARQARAGDTSWIDRLRLALRRTPPAAAQRSAAKQALEHDGTLSCVECGLAHRPWRNQVR